VAKTKAKGTTKLGRDSISKRLGIKLSDGQIAEPGNIIIRQRGTKWVPGEGVLMGKDYTIFATQEGKVKFYKKRLPKFTGKLKEKSIVSVETTKH
jgi:large subunit ribosomal protein L27